MSSYDAPPPTKASLLKWWKSFTKSHSNPSSSPAASTSNARPAPPPYQPASRGLPQGSSGEGRVFGVSPEQSLKYASVAISMVGPCVTFVSRSSCSSLKQMLTFAVAPNSDGKPYVYGYVPIVVAKCGMMLKETGASRALALCLPFTLISALILISLDNSYANRGYLPCVGIQQAHQPASSPL